MIPKFLRRIEWKYFHILYFLGISSSDQHLLFGQKELLNDLTLLDQGVQNGSVLKLILAIKGGPINIGRNSSEDNLWREFTDYMDVNK